MDINKDLENLLINIQFNMKDIGIKINFKAPEKFFSVMVQYFKENFKKVLQKREI